MKFFSNPFKPNFAERSKELLEESLYTAKLNLRIRMDDKLKAESMLEYQQALVASLQQEWDQQKDVAKTFSDTYPAIGFPNQRN
jgi:hypothetical protein